MSNASASSASNTGPTSTSGPTSRSKASAEKAADAAKAAEDRLKDEAKKVDEADFLQKQADDAKRAISAAVADAKAALAEGMDPREWTRRYPMVAIGSAVAAGFVAAVLTIPSKQQQQLKKLEKIRRALHPEATKAKDAAERTEAKVDALHDEHKGGSWWSSLLREALNLIRPVLMSAVTSQLTKNQTAKDPAGAAAPSASSAASANPPPS